MKEVRPRFRFRPWLALGIAVLHFVIFVVVAWFALMGALSGSGAGSPFYQGPGMAEIAEILLAPTLLIPLLFGIKPMSFQLLFLTVAASSVLYGVLLSLLISRILSRRELISTSPLETDAGRDPY